MIIVTRLSGHAMAVNPDLIERAEETPDTVITMVDGHKMLISDSIEELVDKVRIWRASVAAEAFALSTPAISAIPAIPAIPVSPASEPRQDVAAAAQGRPDVGLARVLHLPTRQE